MLSQTNNPGPWFLHCHIDWHLEAGFGIVFAEDTGDVASVNPVPRTFRPLDKMFNSHICPHLQRLGVTFAPLMMRLMLLIIKSESKGREGRQKQ